MSNYGITEDGKLLQEYICEDGRVELGGAITGDGRIVSLFMVFGTDAGAGVDALLEHIAAISNSDVGVGSESEIIGLCDSDVGIGVDELTDLLGEITSSDVGSGTESSTVEIFIYLLLKLLQDKDLNIDLSQKLRGLSMELSQERRDLDLEASQEGRDVNLRLSQEDKGLNLKLSQEEAPN